MTFTALESDPFFPLKKSFDEAISAATVALTNDPENVKARYRRALACLETQDRVRWQEAAEDLEALAKASPKSANFRQSLAEARKKLGEDTAGAKSQPKAQSPQKKQTPTQSPQSTESDAAI